jgi:phytoene dehydrogenase-like protein
MQQHPVIIVGAGLAGLCCARELQQRQIPWLLFEAKSTVGGRLQTDQVDGYLIDHGFQVLQTAYPEARQQLDYDQLRLRRFSQGALIRTGGRFVEMVDPWRSPQKLRALYTVLFNGVGTFADRLRLGALRNQLKYKTPQQNWQAGNTDCSTRDYLLNTVGFSKDIVQRFFRPWFAGVFLEPDLATSSRMFRFLFGMFASGETALPADGMQAIPRQLMQPLPAAHIRLNTRVQSVTAKSVTLVSGETLDASAVVLAVEGPAAEQLTGGLWKSAGTRATTCLNFAADHAPIAAPILVLNGDEDGPINNLSVISNVAPETAPPGKALVSVSLIGDFGSKLPQTEAAVRSQLAKWYGPSTAGWRLLRTHVIRVALPALLPDSGRQTDGLYTTPSGIHLAGDFVSTGSIHSAMLSGRLTATKIAETLHGQHA